MHAVKEYPEHVPIKELPPYPPPKKKSTPTILKKTHTKKGKDKRVLKEEEEEEETKFFIYSVLNFKRRLIRNNVTGQIRNVVLLNSLKERIFANGFSGDKGRWIYQIMAIRLEHIFF